MSLLYEMSKHYCACNCRLWRQIYRSVVLELGKKPGIEVDSNKVLSFLEGDDRNWMTTRTSPLTFYGMLGWYKAASVSIEIKPRMYYPYLSLHLILYCSSTYATKNGREKTLYFARRLQSKLGVDELYTKLVAAYAMFDRKLAKLNQKKKHARKKH